ncbi:helix-turn-helix domain-containing protein [Rhizobium sp. Root1204]|uniref:helix-turn-helix domain-containing protein n=1 Tax=Rhizobium sp. Root1204 TaxID=1736428 RepID=UPI000712CB3B|nr:helix-turn-helix domain-containing protein [Rhizobium sp. Root1204]KQV36989.1 hypothetical protein ASC96_26560 [Rhizobium sp. Root1204]
MRSIVDANFTVSNGSGAFPAWREMMSENYSKTHCIRLGDAPFSGELNRQQLGSIEVGVIRSSPLFYRRGIAEIRQNPTDGFNILYVMDGQIKVKQADSTALVEPGNFVLYHHGSPFEIEIGQAYTATSVTIPYKLLSSRLRDATRLTAHTVTGASPNGLLACSLMSQFVKPENLTGLGRADSVSQAMIEIIASALENSAGFGTSPSMPSGVLARAKEYMLQHLEDADLDLDHIASEAAVSKRTLIRAFSVEGATPMHWLWQQRLKASFESLSAGRIDNVTTAAFAAGFKDVSHFSKAFKRAFGVSPSEVLVRN